MSGGLFESAIVSVKGEQVEIRATVLVAASGGFESNLEWLEEAWGPAARNFLIRGTPYNKGRVLKLLLENGAQAVGDPKQCHAVAIDARAPKFDGGIVTRLDSLPLGIVLNKHGARFYDEGEDLWPRRYAIWGRLVAQQEDQIAYSIVDSKLVGKFMPSVFPAVRANTIGELATQLGLRSAAVEDTIAAIQSGSSAGHVRPDSPRRLPDEWSRDREDPLGAENRHAALSGLSASSGDYVHVSGRRGRRECAAQNAGRVECFKRVRRGRDHGRQYFE